VPRTRKLPLRKPVAGCSSHPPALSSGPPPFPASRRLHGSGLALLGDAIDRDFVIVARTAAAEQDGCQEGQSDRLYTVNRVFSRPNYPPSEEEVKGRFPSLPSERSIKAGFPARQLV
jgi:hypothetical protein